MTTHQLTATATTTTTTSTTATSTAIAAAAATPMNMALAGSGLHGVCSFTVLGAYAGTLNGLSENVTGSSGSEIGAYGENPENRPKAPSSPRNRLSCGVPVSLNMSLVMATAVMGNMLPARSLRDTAVLVSVCGGFWF